MARIKLQKLHSGQLPIAAGMRDMRRVVIRCGRRFGKTSLLERAACKLAYQGKRVGWFGPTYKLNLPSYRRILTTLRPIVTSANKIDQMIECTSGGAVEFWTLQDEDAGRSRFYDVALIDEASIAVGLRDIFEQSIAPTLLDHQGQAIMAGTPKGIDPDNYFYSVCTDPTLGWHEFYAPTQLNPMLAPEAVAALKDENPPLVYQQEYLADFVDWRGTAFFADTSLLEDGEPATMESIGRIDQIFAVVDTALKDGREHDGTAIVYCGKRKIGGEKLYILDWDVMQIEGATLEKWLPSVGDRLQALSAEYRAREGVRGIWIEDKGSGTILLQQARHMALQSWAIPESLVSAGKEGRALNISSSVYRGLVKLTKPALDKTTRYRGEVKNHLLSQVCGFRLGTKNRHEMDLLDCFCYAVALALGDSKGY